MSTLSDLVPDDFNQIAESLLARTPAGDIAVSLTVESVSPLPPHPMRAQPFSVILRGPRLPALPQGIYSIDHPRRGPVDLFLVPIAEDAHGRRYEATFN